MMPFFAAVLPVVVLFCGLSIDVGMLQLRKLQLQTAADAGALGAELEMERNTGNWVNAGKLDAAINGYTDGINNVTVAVALSPTENAYAGDYSAIQVTVTQQVRTLFMGALNGGSSTVSAKGVASIPPCSYFSGAMQFPNIYPFEVQSANVSMPCPLYATTKISVDYFSRLTATNGINVAGVPGDSYLTGRISPTPRFNALPMGDPLAYLPSPSFSLPCTTTPHTLATGYTLTSGSDTISPGTYCNGITVNGATLNFSPGVYVITGQVSWTNYSTINGTGVTLFFTKGGGAGYGGLTIDRSTIRLSAPSQGQYATILIYGDRNWVANGPDDFAFKNYSTFQGDGIWYLTGTGLFDWQSDFRGINYCGIVADNMLLFGATMTPLNNYSNIPTGNPFRPLGGLVQ